MLAILKRRFTLRCSQVDWNTFFSLRCWEKSVPINLNHPVRDVRCKWEDVDKQEKKGWMEKNRMRLKRKQRWCKSVRTPFGSIGRGFFLLVPSLCWPFSLASHSVCLLNTWFTCLFLLNFRPSLSFSLECLLLSRWYSIQYHTLSAVQFIPPKLNFRMSFNAFV